MAPLATGPVTSGAICSLISPLDLDYYCTIVRNINPLFHVGSPKDPIYRVLGSPYHNEELNPFYAILLGVCVADFYFLAIHSLAAAARPAGACCPTQCY